MKQFNEKGMTLIEVIISMAIMAIVIIPLTSIFMSTYKINATSQNNMEAKSAAMLIIDSIEQKIRLAKKVEMDISKDLYLTNHSSREKDVTLIYFEPDSSSSNNTNLIAEVRNTSGELVGDKKILVDNNLFYDKTHQIEFSRDGSSCVKVKVNVDGYVQEKSIKVVQPGATIDGGTVGNINTCIAIYN